MDINNIVQIITVFIGILAIIATVIITHISKNRNINAAEKSFKRTATLQTEIFILGAYKDYMDIMYSDASDERKNNAKTRFLMAIDLYCKYVLSGY